MWWRVKTRSGCLPILQAAVLMSDVVDCAINCFYGRYVPCWHCLKGCTAQHPSCRRDFGALDDGDG